MTRKDRTEGIFSRREVLDESEPPVLPYSAERFASFPMPTAIPRMLKLL